MELKNTLIKLNRFFVKSDQSRIFVINKDRF